MDTTNEFIPLLSARLKNYTVVQNLQLLPCFLADNTLTLQATTIVNNKKKYGSGL